MLVDTLIEIGDDTEDWNKRKAWLNSVLNELWTARGPYPGFPSILESLGLHTFVSSYIGLTFDDEMKEYRIAVREFLEGNRDDVQGMTLSKSDMKKIRREYQLLDDDTADFMFEILSRFDLRADQVCSIVSEDRENVSITASIAEMKENPYIIFEQYIGYDSDDVIPFYRIDNGVIPSPEYGIDEILDCGSTERLRAFCVDELNRIAAHSFGKAKSILKTINARVERLPEWKRYVYRMKNFDIDQEIWEGALVQKKDDQGILYLYLKENYEDERTIEDALRNLADRPDITLKMAITPEKFKRGLRVEGSPLEKKTAAEYDLILEHQAEICMQIFVKPLCVLSGAAGTGKTTVIRTILDNIERVHGAGTSFLLMAPTGKAAERIKTQTGKPSSTIHSYLAKNGWINENFTLKRIGGRDSQDINTIIIDECSMIDLNLMATLFRAINWNSIQRLILIGDPNQLSPIGRGRVFADTIEWLNAEYPQNVGTLTDNIRQLVNRVEGNGNGILNLAEIFIQEHQQLNDGNESARLKAEKESLFEQILESGNGDVDKDLGVYFWNEQEELESVLTNVMVRDMQQHTGMDVTAKSCAIIPSVDGYVESENAYWAAVPQLTQLFSNEQLSDITENANAQWVFVTLGRDEVQRNNKALFSYIEDLIKTNLNEDAIINGRSRDFYYNRILGIRQTLENVKGITKEFIEKQTISWLHDFYKWLSETKHRTDIITEKPIFLDQKGRAVAAFDEDNQLILFLPVKNVDGYTVVNDELLKNDETKKYIESIGVKQPSLKDQIYNIILPQYKDGIEIDTDPHFMIFFNFYCKCSNEEIEEFIDLIKDCEFLRNK